MNTGTKRVLVTYATKYGSTTEIAQAIADELDRQGIAVDCKPAADVTGVVGYDAVVLGSAVYMKRWRRPARRLLSRFRRDLAQRELWIFSSGPVGKDPDLSWARPGGVIRMAEKLGAHEHRVFGGRVPLEPQGPMAKAMLRDTPEELRDARDFDESRGWATGIAQAVAPGAAASVS